MAAGVRTLHRVLRRVVGSATRCTGTAWNAPHVRLGPSFQHFQPGGVSRSCCCRGRRRQRSTLGSNRTPMSSSSLLAHLRLSSRAFSTTSSHSEDHDQEKGAGGGRGRRGGRRWGRGLLLALGVTATVLVYQERPRAVQRYVTRQAELAEDALYGFVEGTIDEQVEQTLRTGDVLLFQRTLTQVDEPFRWFLIDASRAVAGTPYEHIGVIICDPEDGVPYVLEHTTFGLRLTRYDHRCMGSRSHSILLRRVFLDGEMEDDYLDTPRPSLPDQYNRRVVALIQALSDACGGRTGGTLSASDLRSLGPLVKSLTETERTVGEVPRGSGETDITTMIPACGTSHRPEPWSFAELSQVLRRVFHLQRVRLQHFWMGSQADVDPIELQGRVNLLDQQLSMLRETEVALREKSNQKYEELLQAAQKVLQQEQQKQQRQHATTNQGSNAGPSRWDNIIEYNPRVPAMEEEVEEEEDYVPMTAAEQSEQARQMVVERRVKLRKALRQCTDGITVYELQRAALLKAFEQCYVDNRSSGTTPGTLLVFPSTAVSTLVLQAIGAVPLEFEAQDFTPRHFTMGSALPSTNGVRFSEEITIRSPEQAAQPRWFSRSLKTE